MSITTPPRIYLASSSPRRRELLNQIGVQCDVLLFRSGGARGKDTDLDETPLPDEQVDHYVERLARGKAVAGMKRVQWRHLPEQPVMAADTALDVDGKIVGKPTTPAEAYEMLQQLSGRSHRVLTAVALGSGEHVRSMVSISEVRFRRLEDKEIQYYVGTGDPLDKAGGYAIQGFAAIFIKEIRGSYSGIMGLPLYETAKLLHSFGYSLRP